MNIFVALGPAAITAAGIRSLASNLERTIDSARRGSPTQIDKLIKQLEDQLKVLKRELPRAA